MKQICKCGHQHYPSGECSGCPCENFETQNNSPLKDGSRGTSPSVSGEKNEDTPEDRSYPMNTSSGDTSLSDKIMIDQWDEEQITSKIFTEDVRESIKKLEARLKGIMGNNQNLYLINREIYKIFGEELVK